MGLREVLSRLRTTRTNMMTFLTVSGSSVAYQENRYVFDDIIDKIVLPEAVYIKAQESD